MLALGEALAFASASGSGSGSNIARLTRDLQLEQLSRDETRWNPILPQALEMDSFVNRHPPSAAAISVASERIAVAYHGVGVRLYDLITGARVRTIDIADRMLVDIVFDERATRIAALSQQGELTLLDPVQPEANQIWWSEPTSALRLLGFKGRQVEASSSTGQTVLFAPFQVKPQQTQTPK